MLDNNLKISVSNLGIARRSIVFGEARYGPRGICGPRIQTDYQLVVMLSGSAKVNVKAQGTIDIQELQVALMLPGLEEVFYFDPSAPVYHSWCAVHPRLVSADLGERLANAPKCLRLTPRMRQLVELGISLTPTSAQEAEGFMEHLGLAALENYLFEASVAKNESTQPEAIRRAIHFIEDNLSEQIHLEAICDAAFVSKQHLIRIFKKSLGTTPSIYVWKLRTERGVDMLRETGVSVSEIATQLGFQSAYHFSRLVKQEYGQSPRQLRATEWQFLS